MSTAKRVLLDEKEYKGFLIYLDKFYIESNEIDQTKEYEFKSPYLVEVKEYNKKVYKLNEYMGNKTIYDAIDVYFEYKDMELLRPAHSLVLDYWYDVLKRDTNLFYNTFGFVNIDIKFIDFDSCMEYWENFGLKDIEMNKFLTNDKIAGFWDIQKVNDLIKHSRVKNFNRLVF